MRLFLLIFTSAVLLAWTTASAQLQPDQLLLITNKNMPEGRVLAELYASQRGVPDGRIVEIPLPVTEEVDARQYDEHILPAVREFLEQNKLQDQVKCLVTFYGMPLRLRQRAFTPAEQQEIAELKQQTQQITGHIQQIVSDLEQMVETLTAANSPATAPAAEQERVDSSQPTSQPHQTVREQSNNPDDLSKRADLAIKMIESAMPKLDQAQQHEVLQKLLQVMEQLTGRAGIVDRVRVKGPADSDEAVRLRTLREQVAGAAAGANQLQGQQHDPAARGQLRQIVGQNFGLIAYAKLINSQLEILNPSQTTAALDSELALLWWGDYPRARWLINPLYFRARASGQIPPVLMVSRLDGPTPQVVRRMIMDAAGVEKKGLTGVVLVDAGGSLVLGSKGKQLDEYGRWDQYLKDLAQLTRSKSRLGVVLDDQAQVIQPEDRVNDVALYCGWYSLRHFVPGMALNRGAIAIHIASFEAVSVRGDNEKGWVAGLLYNGAAATVGPVAEPYLSAFPRPDELFPLLMTGKLTLAEAYWRTVPTISWMMVLFGDPLYQPYAKNPALQVGDLPAGLRQAIDTGKH